MVHGSHFRVWDNLGFIPPKFQNLHCAPLSLRWKNWLCQWRLNSEWRISSDLYLNYNMVFNLELGMPTQVDVRYDCVKEKILRQYFRITQLFVCSAAWSSSPEHFSKNSAKNNYTCVLCRKAPTFHINVLCQKNLTSCPCSGCLSYVDNPLLPASIFFFFFLF